jgi:hypothetical protein
MGQYLAVRRNNRRLLTLVIVFSLLLLLVTTARFLMGIRSSTSSQGGFDTMMPSTNWITKYSGNVTVITNFHTAGLLFFSTVQAHGSDNVTVYFSQFAQIADFLATANMTGTREYLDKRGYECVLIPTEMQYSATSIGAWAIVGRVQPLGESTFAFDNFLIFNKIYDDGQGMFYNHKTT